MLEQALAGDAGEAVAAGADDVPLEVDVDVVPVLKASSIAAALAGSFFQRLSSVSLEKTTPQPKVSSGRLRSTTRTSCAGSRSFIEIAKYSPAGPPPMQTILMQHPSRRARLIL